jgi:predicted transcriptional regulator
LRLLSELKLSLWPQLASSSCGTAPGVLKQAARARAMINLESMTSREELHKIIDSLADDQIAEVRQYIDELCGEESLSEETLAAIREGLSDVEHGRVMDVQEYRRTRGL